MFKKFGATSLLTLNGTSSNIVDTVELHKVGFKDFNFTPEPGYVYTVSRAISSRVNANYDGWPVEGLRENYRTFIGRPVFVEHNNSDHTKAKGVILDALYKESKLRSGITDASVYCLMEVDGESFPRLATAIMEGRLNAVSMGADVEGTICSGCGKYASKPSEFCEHIPRLKGHKVAVYKEGRRVEALIWENCVKPNFFELSYVFEPADESAWLLDKMRVPR